MKPGRSWDKVREKCGKDGGAGNIFWDCGGGEAAATPSSITQ